jgi:beta-galactosidase
MKMKVIAGMLLLGGLTNLVAGASNAPTALSMPDEGWRLWPDTKATWKNDALYLPDDVDLKKLPTNAPTGGWATLDDSMGIAVTLPSTVEQHYWGKFGLRPYTTGEYTYAATDPEVRNGNYEGVSWWWRDVQIPESFRDKLVLLHIRGARQRAEVYVNQRLVGYDLIAETAFDCDITDVVKPGQKNTIAIRITNPGGRMDWMDFQTMNWGKYSFQKSHGFGGLDRGITITAHDPVYLQDTWVLNTPQVRTATAHASLRNETDEAESGTVVFSVIDPKTGQAVATRSVQASVAAHSNQEIEGTVSDDHAMLWSTQTPYLYRLRALWTGRDRSGGSTTDFAEKTFGFRWFEPRGVGKEAGLYLNNSRVRIYTAISWGFWGLNGLWPTPDLAEKEVKDAKELGMNCLNFHRDIGKEEVLAQQDEQGLMRYMEAGGGATTLGKVLNGSTRPAPTGEDTSGKGGDATTFAEKYEEIKILRMIKQFRSHPSLIIYVIQNEIEPDLSKPRVFDLIRKMHALDPSRVIATKSGISPNHQVWFAPYDDTVHCDDGTGYSGWRDQHTVGGPGVWVDNLYQGPDAFTHRIDNQKQIVDWGEMLGSATPDNHPVDIRQIAALGGVSYDLKDHQEVDAAYNQFLDHWGFRSAFLTTEKLFSDVGNKCYQFWGRVIETARLAEGNDILTMSGWESTAIENHSGLVDNLRNLKGAPELISKKLAALLPVVKPRGLVYRVGDEPIVDLYLLNETNRPTSGQLHLKLTDPTGAQTELATLQSPAFVADQFVYPLKLALSIPPLKREGIYTLSFNLDGSTPAENSETLRAVDLDASNIPDTVVGIIGDTAHASAALAGIDHLAGQAYKEGSSYKLLIVQPQAAAQVIPRRESLRPRNIADPEIYAYSVVGKPGAVHFKFEGLPPGPAQVSLYFADPESRASGHRIFDVQINDKRVLQNFDIAGETGGETSAIVKTFSVDAPAGTVDIFSPRAAKSSPLFDAVQIEAGGKRVAVVGGGDPFTDSTGQRWQPYVWPQAISDAQIEQVRQGTPLLVLASDLGSADQVAKRLAGAGAFEYAGDVPQARASWMGSWIITRRHALFDHLPSDEVMKGDYQDPVGSCYGLLVDGPTVQVVAAYGRDHDRHIGAALFTAKLGKGDIVFSALSGMQPVMQEQLLENEVRYLLLAHQAAAAPSHSSSDK